MHERFEAGEAHLGLDPGDLARRHLGGVGGDLGDVLGCGAAAAADDVNETLAHPRLDQARHLAGALVVLAHGVGQAGIGIGDDARLGDGRNLGDVGTHQLGAERAVEAEREGPQVAHGEVERLRRLAGQGAARAVGDGAGDDQRQLDAHLVEHGERGKAGRLGIQRVEDGLDQQHVGAALDQAARLLGVGLDQLVVADVAEARVVDVGRDGGGAVGRPHGAGDDARPVGRLGRYGIGRGARQLCGGHVHLEGEVLHAVVGQRDALRIEGVGADDVGAGLQVGRVDGADRLRLGQHQQVVVALDQLAVIGEALAAVILLLQLQALDHGAHRTVDDEDALVGGLLECRNAVAAGHAFTASGWAFSSAGLSRLRLGFHPRRAFTAFDWTTGSGRRPNKWQMA